MQIITSYCQPAKEGTIATVGMFDGVHLGHRYLLAELTGRAKEMGLASSVITFTDHPLGIIDIKRKPGMLTTVAERLQLLETCCIDYCYLIEFTDELRQYSSTRFIEKLKAEIGLKAILAGFDNSFGKKGESTLEDSAGKNGVHFFRHSPLSISSVNVSSSEIRKCLSDTRIKKANEYLGRNYSIIGTVVHGRQLGRTIGYPTANISLDSAEKIIPACGVYACMAFIEGFGATLRPAMVNIGTNPTVNSSDIISIEANFIGLETGCDLYGRSVRLFFVDFIRSEQRFPSIEELTHQLKRDSVKCLEILEPLNQGKSDIQI